MRIVATAVDFDAHWRRLCETATRTHALYGPHNLQFYRAYYQKAFTDHSVAIVVDKTLAAGLRVTSHCGDDGVTVFSCFGQPSLFVESRAIDAVTRRRANNELKDYVDELTANVTRWRWEHLDPLESGAVCEFSRHLLSSQGRPAVLTTQMLDLSQGEETLAGEMTRTFRWCVNWGRKHIAVRVLDQATITMDDMDAFRTLHVDAAGRETRTYETWQRQFEMVKGQEAFLCLGALEGQLVTAALFSHSPDHCYYGVSASKRELFGSDQPLSHILIWQAIARARELGCRWFEMGDLRFHYQNPPPTEKELGISTFKRNFGGRTFVRLRIVAESSPASA